MNVESQSAELDRLCRVAGDARDAGWIGAFVTALAGSRLAVCEPEIESGPDGFPYFGLALVDGSATGGRLASFDDVVSHCTQRAHCGLVLFRETDRAGDPEWVFSLGDLWSIRLFGSVEGDPVDIAERDAPASPSSSREYLVASPDEEYMPPAMRAALGRYLRDVIQLGQPAVALVLASGYRPMRNLMVNLKGSMFRDDAHRDAVMHYVSWFLPRSRGLMLMPEEWDDERFTPLVCARAEADRPWDASS